MKHTNILSICAVLALAALPALGNSNWKAELGQVAEHAGSIQADALAMHKELKKKNADLDRIQTHMTSLKSALENLNQTLASVDGATLDAAASAKLNDLKNRAELLSVFTNNKENLLASSEPARKRDPLRAIAKGIADRAETISELARRASR